MKKNILSIVMLFGFHFFINAQDGILIKETANENDSIVLVLDDYVGEIQWQSSPDSLIWTDLYGEVSDSLLFLVHDNLYFRAAVTVGICDPFYSDVAYIENTWNFDNDLDGFTENQGDCNDSIPEINPGAFEAECNDGIDQNCDGFDCPVEFDKLDTVCGGNPLNCTAPYNDSSAYHKIIFIDSEGFAEEWNNAIPSYYLPQEMEEVEFVACINSNWNTIETCNYCVGSDCNYKLYRKQHEVEILIYFGSTGELVASDTLTGGTPGICLPNESFNFYTKVKTGSAIVYADIEEWLIGILKIPIVITGEISNITHNSASCFAEVAREDDFSIVERGICWSTSRKPTVNDSIINSGSGIGTFHVELNGLNSLSTYYVRAYAISDSGGIFYGDEKSFQTSGILIDSRDNRSYKLIQAGSQIWMAENLAYLPEVCVPNVECGFWVNEFHGNSVSEAKATDNYQSYGVLYNYETALKVCPSNWHLSSDAEWKELEMYLGMSQAEADDDYSRGTDEGGKLKETGFNHWTDPNTGATNEIGFTALPGGHKASNYFNSPGITGGWWCSPEFDSTRAWNRGLSFVGSRVTRNHYPKNNGYSVRCVKD